MGSLCHICVKIAARSARGYWFLFETCGAFSGGFFILSYFKFSGGSLNSSSSAVAP